MDAEALPAAAARAAWNAATLGAAGLAFFALGFGRRLPASERARLARWARRAAALGVLAAAAALAAQARVLAGGDTVLDPEIWGILLASPAGAASGAGLGGLAAVALALPGRPTVAAAGGVAACAGFLLAGHTTQLAPRAAAAGLLLLHLLVAAAWVGSLPPLAWAARRGGPEAARLLADWSRAAVLAVPALGAAGAALGWWLGGGARGLAGSGYGAALLAKSGLVALMLALAARHRLRLAPALAAGAPGAGPRLARSIGAEAAVAALVLGAAALLAAGRPPGLP